MNENEQYMDIFIEESKEHLQAMSDNLMILESDHENLETLTEIFRSAHTLKGMSGTVGLTKIASLTHEMENAIEALRNRKIEVSEEIVNILFECLGVLDVYVSTVSTDLTEGPYDSSELVKQVNSLLVGLEPIKTRVYNPEDYKLVIDEYLSSEIKKAIEDGNRCLKIKVTISEDCLFKAARAYLLHSTMEEISVVLKISPSIDDIEQDVVGSVVDLLIITKQSDKEIQRSIFAVTEIDEIDMEEITNEDLYQNKTEEVNEKILEVDNKKEESSKKNTVNKNNKPTSKTVRVDTDRLDNLMSLVSELIIIKTGLDDGKNSQDFDSITESIERLERITSNLHDAVIKVRMVSVEKVFNRFPRMVRDLSKDLEKDITLIMKGEETEVDRTVIDEIGDPLIHLIRNSLDHGIENTSERIISGKLPKGTVSLEAYPDGNSVVIEVKDDGKGIDIDKVKSKAVEKGVITKEEADDMDDKTAKELIFKSGFSTADQVSDISGRGVGLDVVKTKIESLGGIIEIISEKGVGTKFIIRLPLTLAIIKALLVTIEDEIYAIPLNLVKEITTIDEKEIRMIQNQEVILYRNEMLSLIRLHEKLDLEKKKVIKNTTVVIVNKGDRQVGLIVGELVGQQEIVIKSLGNYINSDGVISGATILGNGRVALIVDPKTLF